MLEKAAVKSINADELSKMIGRDDVAIIDIRDKESYQKGHIPGALSVNNEQEVTDFLAKTDLKKAIVCCCYHGISSQQVAAYLQTRGFEDVSSLEGGFENWKAHQKTEI